MKGKTARPEKMSQRRALLLAVMAVESAAEDASDIGEWKAAGEILRGLLQQTPTGGQPMEVQHG